VLKSIITFLTLLVPLIVKPVQTRKPNRVEEVLGEPEAPPDTEAAQDRSPEGSRCKVR